MTALQDDCDLLACLYVSCQSRAINLEDFFIHENHVYPPSVSDDDHGNLRFFNKSDLLQSLGSHTNLVTDIPSADTRILDGAALVHFLLCLVEQKHSMIMPKISLFHI